MNITSMPPNRFHVTLPSNVSSVDYFPENLVTNYITKLAKRIKLDGQWEVGLADILYTYSWYNIPETKNIELWYFYEEFMNYAQPSDGIKREIRFVTDTKQFFELKRDEGKAVEITQDMYIAKSRSENTKIKKGLYTDIDNIISEINKNILLIGDQLPHRKVLPTITLDKGSKRVTVNNGEIEGFSPVLLVLPNNLWNILGFDPQRIKRAYLGSLIHKFEKLVSRQKQDNLKLTLTADTPYDLSGGIHALYIYSNIIKPSIVGDSYSQLLRVCKVPHISKFGEQIDIRYSTPYYFPLSSNEIEYIEIDIKDDTGENIKFEYGRVIVTLEFRKIG